MARRRAKKPKAAPTLAPPPALEKPPPSAARNGATTNGARAELLATVAELLAVPDVEVELHVNGAAVLVRRTGR